MAAMVPKPSQMTGGGLDSKCYDVNTACAKPWRFKKLLGQTADAKRPIFEIAAAGLGATYGTDSKKQVTKIK